MHHIFNSQHHPDAISNICIKLQSLISQVKMEFVEIKHEDLPNTKFIRQSSVITMGTMQHDIVNIVNQSFYSQKTPYLTLTGELWNVYCEDLG